MMPILEICSGLCPHGSCHIRGTLDSGSHRSGNCPAHTNVRVFQSQAMRITIFIPYIRAQLFSEVLSSPSPAYIRAGHTGVRTHGDGVV